jgi:type I restriction enzyme S subunit
MRSNAPRPTVAELHAQGVLLVEDGNHGEYRPRSDEFSSQGVAFIRAADMDGGRVLFHSAERINDAAMARIRKGIGRPGDVLLSHKGTVGKVALASDDSPAFVCSPQTTFWRTLDANRLDRQYLYAFMRSPDFRAQLTSRKGETDMADYVSLTAQRQLKVALPKISIQREIGSMIGVLDARIDLLRQSNATLEAIAQALFKSWFIDFDPVRAKTEGREPEGMDAATAALFPAEFEGSSLGSIPLGWHVGDVYEIAEVRYGAPFASRLFNTDGDGHPLARIRDLKDEVPGVWTPEVHPKGTLIQPGSIVVGMDGEFRAYLWGGTPAWMNQRICMFVPAQGHSAAFVRSAISGPLAHVEATETATTVIHLGKSDIDRFRVTVPPPHVARAFGNLSQPIYERIVGNKQTIRSLSGIRDTLLPRLISGQLRLPEARAQVEESLA